jgi:cullin 3
MNQAKKKNFKIEPFKHKVEMDPKYAEKTWKLFMRSTTTMLAA